MKKHQRLPLWPFQNERGSTEAYTRRLLGSLWTRLLTLIEPLPLLKLDKLGTLVKALQRFTHAVQAARAGVRLLQCGAGKLGKERFGH